MNKNFLEKIIDYHNRLSDKKIIWFPFVILKPEPRQKITFARVLVMTFCFGTYGVAVYFLKNLFFETINYEKFMANAVLIFAIFFVWFSFVTSQLWNIRARSLNNHENISV